MSISNIFQISSQGMTAQRERLETTVTNLANANTTKTASGGPYKRRDVIFETIPLTEKKDSEDLNTSKSSSSASEEGRVGVRAYVQVSPLEGRKVFQPNHPDADSNGYVSMPDVDPLEETVNMLSASRAFEANATAFNTAKELVKASLKLAEG
jgi:flagellar basal-body rod protein FlgC